MVPEYFGMISNPSRIDAKRGDHFLEPDWPTRRPLLSYGPAPSSSNRALLRLLFSFVLIVASRPHHVL